MASPATTIQELTTYNPTHNPATTLPKTQPAEISRETPSHKEPRKQNFQRKSTQAVMETFGASKSRMRPPRDHTQQTPLG
ncbi:hypothetical protein Nepgr_031310 [Nepenthes gracilis]|uniref:Uncharacterized protein n=1 Tax=Nepenthes gracilis TaxID=150966 RepID=A0AAD3THA9_NEPGR|nr:hypothetical protein Nepgr_031310 [Nepenthes gracilis]